MNILKVLFINLRTHGESFIHLNDSNVIAVKLQIQSKHPLLIRDYDVPMLLYNPMILSNLPWDIALQHIIPAIDNISILKKVAIYGNMDIEYARYALQMLSYYECIILTDAYKFTNIYERFELYLWS